MTTKTNTPRPGDAPGSRDRKPSTSRFDAPYIQDGLDAPRPLTEHESDALSNMINSTLLESVSEEIAALREPKEFEEMTEAVDAIALTNERKNTHGDWHHQAEIGMLLDDAAHQAHGYYALKPYQRKAVDMILVKVSRILCGDASHADHWDDIAGYAHLGKGGHGK